MPTVVTNIPTFEELDRAAKSAFFTGWNELLHLISDFVRFYEDAAPNTEEWRSERQKYYQNCVAELGQICTWAGQANELALKAKICRASPDLLLLGNDTKLKAIGSRADFAAQRTIDAVDLIPTVNAISVTQLSTTFSERFNTLRHWRNKVMHQGKADVAFDPNEMARLLADQYAEIWPERKFFKDWMAHISQTRHSFFHDRKWSTPHMELIEMYDVCLQTLGGAQIKAVTGLKAKNTRRYVCHACCYEGSLENAGYSQDEFRTCYLEAANSLHCLICDDHFPVLRQKCTDDGCKSDVICASGLYEGLCHACAQDFLEPHRPEADPDSLA